MNTEFSRKKLGNKFLFEFLIGLAVLVLILFLVSNNDLIREKHEVYNSFIIFYLLTFTAYIILKELNYITVAAGTFLMSFVFFLEGFEEFSFFSEDGLVDKIEDFFTDYILLISVLMIFLGFVLVLKSKEKRIDSLKHKTLHDPLTGIYNRRALFQVYGENEITDPITFCYIDLDGFKEINDRNGHDAGDVVLRDFAEIITRHKRGSDQFFRIGGDEFILIIDTLELEVACSIIERFNMLVKEELGDYYLDFTCGYVPVSQALTLEEVLKTADKEMYKKKLDRRK